MKTSISKLPLHVRAVLTVDMIRTEADLLAHLEGAIRDQESKQVFPVWTRKQLHAAKMAASNVHIAILSGGAR